MNKVDLDKKRGGNDNCMSGFDKMFLVVKFKNITIPEQILKILNQSSLF